MSDTTEKEAIERFVDGLRSAADAVLKLQRPDRHPFSSTHFLKSMSDASGSANQLAVMQSNPDFHIIRDAIEKMAKYVQAMAINNHFGIEPQRIEGKNPFVHVSDVLKGLADNGSRIAASKPLTKQVVGEALDNKEMIMRAAANGNSVH